MQFTKYIKIRNKISGFCIVWNEEVVSELNMRYRFAIFIAIHKNRFDSWNPLICLKKKSPSQHKPLAGSRR